MNGWQRLSVVLVIVLFESALAYAASFEGGYPAWVFLNLLASLAFSVIGAICIAICWIIEGFKQ